MNNILFMEQDMIKNWNYIKGVFDDSQRNPRQGYLTVKELEIFEQKLKRSIRKKKLLRILKDSL